MFMLSVSHLSSTKSIKVKDYTPAADLDEKLERWAAAEREAKYPQDEKSRRMPVK